MYRHCWSEDRVFYEDDNGNLMSLPAGFTSLGPQDPFVTMAAGRSMFRAEDLVRLSQLVSGLRTNAKGGP